MNETEEIKSRLSVEQVVGSYLPLKKAGRVFKALCPFHKEKTASFNVNPQMGIYKCFGCGEGGDIFDFVMKIEGLTFPEALQLLADKAGVTIERPAHSAAQFEPSSGISKNRLYELNLYTAKLWHTILNKHASAEFAREYLKKRGLNEQSIKDFMIGYAPAGPVTAKSLSQEGYTAAEQQAAGNPARMQDRITFPICDMTGKVVGFTGRFLERPGSTPESLGPKYWNTPETPLFSKSRVVFALHLAKAAIQDADLTIMAEGQMDVIMLHQYGYKQAVASSGTALTEQQLGLIRRFSDKLAFAYDQDKAGLEAAKRGVEMALQSDLTPYVINVPEGKDPADCVQNNPKAWDKAYTDRMPYMSWLLDQALKGYAGVVLDPIQKKAIAREIVPWLARVNDPVERADWLRLAAARLQTDEANLIQAIAKMKAPRVVADSSAAPATIALLPAQKQTETAIALIFSFPAMLSVVKEQLDDFPESVLTPFSQKGLAILKAGTDLEKLASDDRKFISLHIEECLKGYDQMELDLGQALAEVLLILQRIRSDGRESQKSNLAKQIRQAQAEGDLEKVKELFKDLRNLI